MIEVPAMPYSNANNYIRYSERLAVKLNELLPNGAYWANQFDNIANKKAHENTTAPEIYKQTNENIDAFVCSVGTGGTLSGVATGLRRLKPNIKIGLADPFGSALFSFFNNGELKSEGSSISEGIGQGRITKNLEGLLVDYSCQVSDTDALRVLYDLLYEEGMSVGISAGINMFGALQMAKTLNKGSTIVTVLCDHGMRYQSKIFNYDFLKMKNLPIPFWMNKSSSFIPDVRL